MLCEYKHDDLIDTILLVFPDLYGRLDRAYAGADGFFRTEQQAYDRAVTDWEQRRYFERI